MTEIHFEAYAVCLVVSIGIVILVLRHSSHLRSLLIAESDDFFDEYSFEVRRQEISRMHRQVIEENFDFVHRESRNCLFNFRADFERQAIIVDTREENKSTIELKIESLRDHICSICQEHLAMPV